MQINEILLLDHDISKTVDIFRHQKISIDSVDLCELFEHKTCEKMWIKRSKIGEPEKSSKFAQNQLYVIFLIFVPEKFKKH